MATDHIRYDVLARDALRGVLRRVLTDAAEHGLPGEHHFFITFLSKADGVSLSPRLLAQYPEEMTIILQHQFWGLKVREEQFEVTLTFKKLPATLTVPFEALTAFVDPGVSFGLQFKTVEGGSVETAGGKITPAPIEMKEKPPEPAKPAIAETAEKPQAGEVVSLDSFRKK